MLPQSMRCNLPALFTIATVVTLGMFYLRQSYSRSTMSDAARNVKEGLLAYPGSCTRNATKVAVSSLVT